MSLRPKKNTIIQNGEFIIIFLPLAEVAIKFPLQLRPYNVHNEKILDSRFQAQLGSTAFQALYLSKLQLNLPCCYVPAMYTMKKSSTHAFRLNQAQVCFRLCTYCWLGSAGFVRKLRLLHRTKVGLTGPPCSLTYRSIFKT